MVLFSDQSVEPLRIIEEQNDVGSRSDSGAVQEPHEEAEIFLRRIGSDVSYDQVVHAPGSSEKQSAHPLESIAVVDNTSTTSGDVASEEEATVRNGGGRFEGGESEEEEGEEKEEDAD